MSEHTPGPWTLHPGRNHFYTQCSEGFDFAAAAQTCYYIAGPLHDSDFVADLIVNKLQETGDANARLIAAAPDLLEACKAYIAFENYELPSFAIGSTATTEEKVKEYREHMRNESDIRLQIHEAIAKADGRDQPTESE